MRPNALKSKIESGKAASGFMVMYDWPEMIQMGAHLGFDYVMMDGEHGYLGVPEIARLVRAAESVGITPIARVPRNAPDLILGFLDAGVQCIVIPSVDTAEEARQAVRAAKYYPEGQRGAGYGHPMDWMISQPFSEYVKVANRETMVLPNCETVEGVKNLAEILAVPGIDGVMMGPNDLAQSLGHPGKLDHPDVKAAIAQAKKTVLAAGKILAVPAMDGDAARAAIADGARMTIIGGHRLFIAAAREYLAKARAAA
jgi:4-hydroxy-2-oxoheptanedioate aldolase